MNDLTTTEPSKQRRSDNDVFSDNFRSMLDPRFASTVKSEKVDYEEPQQSPRVSMTT